MLTREQRRCLDFLISYQKAKGGVSPTHDEIAGALGLHSKSGVNRILVGMEERGFIRRLPFRARAIEILKTGTEGLSKRDLTLIAKPLSDWHEDFGDVLWWKFPICEAPYVGGPNDENWPGYHTHWTPIIVPTGALP